MAGNTEDCSSSNAESVPEGAGFGLRATIKMIRVQFSKVKDISTETLHQWLSPATESDRNIVLMDCRDDGEFVVSHLSGSRRVDWKTVDPKDLLDSLPSDKQCTVVCYCSLGYRSASLADRLQTFMKSSEQGKPPGDIQVYNLEGSIFKWANEGRPMVNTAGQPTKQCHPYSMVWGKMLNKELRFYETSKGTGEDK